MGYRGQEPAQRRDAPPPEPGSVHQATVQSVKPFGVFVGLPGHRDGLVHLSQISEEVAFAREDTDDMKQKAMEFFCPIGSKARTLTIFAQMQ